MRVFSDQIAEAVLEAGRLLSAGAPDADAVAGSRRFGPWFGRGQQYVSFNRTQSSLD
jgi:hypothetical protein